MPIPTVVLLHGQPDTAASLAVLRQATQSRLGTEVRVICPDRPGYGANPLPAAGLTANARWLRSWLVEVNAGPTVLVGHSWAGGVAALASITAACTPASDGTGDLATGVVGLVLVASIGPDCISTADRLLAARWVGPTLSAMGLGIWSPWASRRHRRVLSAISDDDQVHALTSIAAMRAGSSWRSFLFEQRALIAELPQLQRALFQITVPTMIVTASRDSVVPARTQRALNCDIRHNRSVTINGGHDLPISHAGEVAAAITRLWDEVAPR